MGQELPTYDRFRTYRWNYDHAPEPVPVDVPEVPGEWTFCGIPVGSPLGMPAGPLLNGRWILYYAGLGFDVLTYKTVRSRKRECYPLPNLQPVKAGQLDGGETQLPATETMQGSWAVSFGMPSMAPAEWRADVEETRKQLPAEKVLSVSVVGTAEAGATIDDLAADYALCARWAVDSGADCVETNFSCPNVTTRDGQLYSQPSSAGLVAERVREAIGSLPLIVKIGHVTEEAQAAELLDALGPFVDALAMTNSVAARIQSSDGELLFDGQPRGICGEATRNASIRQTRLFARLLKKEQKDDVKLIGVGGASSAEHVRAYLDAGAEAVHIATAAMRDPLLGCQIRRQLADGSRIESAEPSVES